MANDPILHLLGLARKAARLAARLTGWKIDIKPASAPDEELEVAAEE